MTLGVLFMILLFAVLISVALAIGYLVFCLLDSYSKAGRNDVERQMPNNSIALTPIRPNIVHSTPIQKPEPTQPPQNNQDQSEAQSPPQTSIYPTLDLEDNLKEVDNRRILVLKKKGSYGLHIPDILLRKHFLPKNEDVNANKARELSKSRGDHVTENTVFENPSFIWKCTVQQDPSNLVDGETEVYVSERRLQAYQCTRNANGWTVEDLGKKYAVFDDKEDHYHFMDETLKADHVSIR